MKYPPRTMQDAVEIVLGDVCVELGFCSMPMEARMALANRERLSATEFAEAVLLGEGMNPQYELQFKKDLAARFVRRFGGNELRTSDFPLVERR